MLFIWVFSSDLFIKGGPTRNVKWEDKQKKKHNVGLNNNNNKGREKARKTSNKHGEKTRRRECVGVEVDENSTAHGGAVIHESHGWGVSHTLFTAEPPSTNTHKACTFVIFTDVQAMGPFSKIGNIVFF